MNENPHFLADKRMALAAEYASKSERLGFIIGLKAQEWPNLRKDVTSDNQAEKLWQRSEIGVEESMIRLRLKAMDKEFSAIKTMLEVLQGEARNQF